jgi:hypothetical protein
MERMNGEIRDIEKVVRGLKKIVLLNLRVLASDITKGKLGKHPIFQQSKKDGTVNLSVDRAIFCE